MKRDEEGWRRMKREEEGRKRDEEGMAEEYKCWTV
jgi:hypothetical protein